MGELLLLECPEHAALRGEAISDTNFISIRPDTALTAAASARAALIAGRLTPWPWEPGRPLCNPIFVAAILRTVFPYYGKDFRFMLELNRKLRAESTPGRAGSESAAALRCLIFAGSQVAAFGPGRRPVRRLRPLPWSCPTPLPCRQRLAYQGAAVTVATCDQLGVRIEVALGFQPVGNRRLAVGQPDLLERPRRAVTVDGVEVGP